MSRYLICLGIATFLQAVITHRNGAIPGYLLMHRYEVVNATARNALCNDGSSAAYYVRNCSANGDAKPGDPDFCAKGTH
jgi:xanthine/uracil permease